MFIPAGEFEPDLGKLGKILVDGKLLVRSIFSLTCHHDSPQEKGNSNKIGVASCATTN
jgi:hypothetical protein